MRKEILDIRIQLEESDRIKKSAVICNNIMNRPEYRDADTIFCYISTKGEVDMSLLIKDAWKNGKKIAVPKIQNGIMNFYYIYSFEELVCGTYQIMEPHAVCEAAVIDSKNPIVIVPGIAYDRTKNRIGYGAGYYDKYFSEYPSIYKIAPAFDLQIVDSIMTEDCDIKMNVIITESQYY